MKKLGVLAAILVLLLGIGCGDDDDDGSSSRDRDTEPSAGSGGSDRMDGGTSGRGGEDDAGGGGGAGGAEPIDGGQDAAGATPPTLADLQGTWLGPCYQQDGDYWRAVQHFEGNRATMTLAYYGENNPICQNAVLSIVLQAVVSIGPPIWFLPGVYRLDAVITGVVAAMNTAGAVAYANAEGLFGYTDWELNAIKDVAGREFASSNTDAGVGDPLPKVGDQFWMNFTLNDAKDRLRISDMSGGGWLSDEYVKQ